ncbi:MAG: DNA polymerase I [Lachnospiraceae bacterium]|nr:DNA polymerase I [Candidatus Merdinaster equi]
MSKLVLIDGHSILNRAFYGIPDLTNSEGLHTNAIYGFLNILFHFLAQEKPDYLTIAFDMSAPTFRHKIYEAYKGTRKPMADELRQQVPVMQEVLRAMGIKLVMQEGLEADDLLGTIAKRAEKEGVEVSLVSGDRDLLQIASDHIKIRIPKTKGNQTTVEDYYAKDVEELYGVDPQGFIDLKALMGDTSDNIPGVPKVGEKTASELLKTYKTLDNLYEHVEEITKKAIKESLIANRELAELSKVLATININAEFSYDLEEARLGNIYTPEAYQMFVKLGFKKFLDRFEADAKAEVSKDKPELSLSVPNNEKEADEALKRILSGSVVGYELVHMDSDSSMLSSGSDGQLCFDFSEKKERLVAYLTIDAQLVYKLDSDRIGLSTVERLLSNLVEEGNNSIHLCGFDVKKDYRFFCPNEYINGTGRNSVEASHIFDDTHVAAYLLNPIKSDYSIEDVAAEYAAISMQSYSELFGKASVRDVFANDENNADLYYMNCAAANHLAYEALMRAISEVKSSASMSMSELYRNTEMPLTYVLYRMEQCGISVKRQQLQAYSDMLGSQIEILEKKIYEGAGEEFNINSPKQLGEILFDKMGLEGGKKTKTGYSTAADVLEKLAIDYPFVRDVLEYRGLAKLKSTYADGLPEFISEDGKIHTCFHQTITATGRISSTDPNLQNIPMRTELGRQIRKVFVPSDGCVFVDGDYSQVELRILAHMSGDEGLLEAYRQGQDIHTSTASKVFGVPFDEVTPIQRRSAKAVNFGIVYGISAFGLARDLDISRKEASGYIDTYFETYPGIKKYLDEAVLDAKEQKASFTLYGRRRPIPELASSNFMQRQFGERIAMNAPIQGTAADIMKFAMIRVHDGLISEGLKAKLILQIHDELLIECEPSEKDAVMKVLKDGMENAAKLLVDLEVDAHIGEDFYEVK